MHDSKLSPLAVAYIQACTRARAQGTIRVSISRTSAPKHFLLVHWFFFLFRSVYFSAVCERKRAFAFIQQNTIVAVVCLLGACHCGVLLPAQRLLAAPAVAAVAPAVAINTDFDPAPQYAYAYNIQDSITGDQKSQQETRDGDVVKGNRIDST